MFKFFFKIIFISLFLLKIAYAEIYNEIVITGNSRITDETILLFSKLPNSKSLNENSLNLILKNLYDTKFFKDVSIKINEKKLFISVIEQPIIQTVFIEGIKSSKIEKLIKETLTLKDRSSFNLSSIKKDEISALNILKTRGYYFVKIQSSITELSSNKINLTYSFDLGKKAKIKKISFIGNKKFKDNKLKSIIASEEYGFWKVISGKKYVNEEIINLDKRLLTNFYKNKGYYNVSVNSSYANYLNDNKFKLIYSIDAGKRFYFNEFKLNLPIDYNVNDFSKLNSVFKELKGVPYSLNSIKKILDEIDEISLYQDYEFLSSTVNEQLIDDLINFEFNIQETEKFYIEKINIYGNNVTREEVIRNNLLADEGDAFNSLKHQKSINNIKGLTFFRKINTEILDGSTDIQKIINITVEEKPTGEISAGAGVGTSGGTIAFGVTENNFLGRGIEFSSDLTVSSESVKGLMSVNNPNYQGTDKSLNFTLESTVTDRLKNFGYKSNKTGFSVGSGYEYYKDLFLVAGFSTYIETLKTDSTASSSVRNQKGSYTDTYLNYSLNYDKRNQKFQPSDGFLSRFTQNIPIISENYTLKNSYDYKIYNEWLNENIATFGFFVSSANSITSKNVKLSDRLFLPSSKLRGFESGKLGPIDGADYVGGNYAMSFNVASTIPQILPNSQSTDFSIFFDVANVWGVDYNSNLSDNSKIRSSIGIALDYFTPIGPLNFSLTEVITKDKNDITESFRFNLGTTF